jgi:hypothetical protein
LAVAEEIVVEDYSCDPCLLDQSLPLHLHQHVRRPLSANARPHSAGSVACSTPWLSDLTSSTTAPRLSRPSSAATVRSIPSARPSGPLDQSERAAPVIAAIPLPRPLVKRGVSCAKRSPSLSDTLGPRAGRPAMVAQLQRAIGAQRLR